MLLRIQSYCPLNLFIDALLFNVNKKTLANTEGAIKNRHSREMSTRLHKTKLVLAVFCPKFSTVIGIRVNV
jgi:hypothetical protein